MVKEKREGTLSDSSDSTGAEKASLVAVVVAFLLAVSKLFLFFYTGSLVVALSAWDSAADTIISFANKRVLRFARQEADADHPYGHGKAEHLAALAQGSLIIGGAIAIFVSAADRLVHALRKEISFPEASWVAAAFFVFAGLASLALTFWLRRAARQYNSPALFADSEHYRVDVLSNFVSAVSLVAVIVLERGWLDPLFALGLSAYVAWGGWDLVKTSLADLMDKDVPDALKQEALDVVLSVSDKIVDIHNFRGRRSGHRVMFDFHLTLPATLPFEEAHDIVERVEAVVSARFGGDCVIHPDPDSVPLSSRERPYSRKTERT
jgi:cation diffusion facilitator family transporter